ncbi:MAG: hypothetical protein JXR48_11945 [Candidatus Delongbacteria bacterium]|nr:hypothetical protein [Candidatus Delongbacteria bacterium]MBN2835664.1 hypothetical protein [Candidatus Delongbacteria bacterium]
MENIAWVVSADMGYGHQRAADALKFLNNRGVLTEENISDESEKKLWRQIRENYERVSRTKEIPVIGKFIFKLLDLLLYIQPYYPSRDLSKPTFQVKLLDRMIRKGICRSIKKLISKENIPLFATFYTSPIALDNFYDNKIFLFICDTDCNRVWVSKTPNQSKIIYLTANNRAKRRLIQYGINPSNIFVTGFPFSKSVLGNENLSFLRSDFHDRIGRLDPEKKFLRYHSSLINEVLKIDKDYSSDILTIAFCVGGAGAQADIGVRILQSLLVNLKENKVKLILVAGTRADTKIMFEKKVASLGIDNSSVEILYESEREEYFNRFNRMLRKVDILWTKPSELVFFAGLGIVVIMTEPLGSQEEFNRSWLKEIGGGLDSYNPDYTNEWLFDMLNSGKLARTAWTGFMNIRKYGTYRIEEIIKTGKLDNDNQFLRR